MPAFRFGAIVWRQFADWPSLRPTTLDHARSGRAVRGLGAGWFTRPRRSAVDAVNDLKLTDSIVACAGARAGSHAAAGTARR